MGESPRYSLTRIVGTGRDEFLLSHDLPLPRPAALVLEARKTVLIDRTDLTPGSVLLQGRLRAVWIYQVAETPTGGPLWSSTADIPFNVLLRVPVAKPGMGCRVVEAHVTADASEVPGPETIRDRSLVAVTVELTDQVDVATPEPRPNVVATRPATTSTIGRFSTSP